LLKPFSRVILSCDMRSPGRRRCRLDGAITHSGAHPRLGTDGGVPVTVTGWRTSSVAYWTCSREVGRETPRRNEATIATAIIRPYAAARTWVPQVISPRPRWTRRCRGPGTVQQGTDRRYLTERWRTVRIRLSTYRRQTRGANTAYGGSTIRTGRGAAGHCRAGHGADTNVQAVSFRSDALCAHPGRGPGAGRSDK